MRTVAPLLDPLSRAGWTDNPQPKPATTTIATLDFDGGRHRPRITTTTEAWSAA